MAHEQFPSYIYVLSFYYTIIERKKTMLVRKTCDKRIKLRYITVSTK